MSPNEFIIRTFRTTNEYKTKKKTFFSIFIFYSCILNVFFFSSENSVDPKNTTFLACFFLSLKYYRLPIEFIIFWWDHGWNKLTFIFLWYPRLKKISTIVLIVANFSEMCHEKWVENDCCEGDYQQLGSWIPDPRAILKTDKFYIFPSWPPKKISMVLC